VTTRDFFLCYDRDMGKTLSSFPLRSLRKMLEETIEYAGPDSESARLIRRAIALKTHGTPDESQVHVRNNNGKWQLTVIIRKVDDEH